MKRVKRSRLLYPIILVFLVFVLSGIVEANAGSTAVFPFVTSDSKNVTTLVTIMVPASNPTVNCLHFRYFFKANNAPLTAPCLETDFWVTTSPNDLMTFDVGGLIGGGKALYGDTDSIEGFGFGSLSNFITYGINSFIGYLTVETGTVAPGGNTCQGIGANPPTAPQPLPPDGEAVIHDLAQGTSWAYRAFSNVRYHGEQAILSNGYAAPTSWLPTNFANTEFIVTPVDLDGTGAKSAIVRLMLDGSVGGVFDRNEISYSQSVEQEVTCVGVVNVNNLLATVNATNPTLRTEGGWSFLNNRRIQDQDLVNDAWVYKVETYSKYGLVNGKLPPSITWVCGTFPHLVLCKLPFPQAILQPTFVNAVPNGGSSIFVTTP